MINTSLSPDLEHTLTTSASRMQPVRVPMVESGRAQMVKYGEAKMVDYGAAGAATCIPPKQKSTVRQLSTASSSNLDIAPKHKPDAQHLCSLCCRLSKAANTLHYNLSGF